ncbi:MAG TPA: deoxyribose-phosphate aldolase [Holophaga sp.]|nr:deoxyribose-phosphate aldolase [Holophaga sp.]
MPTTWTRASLAKTIDHTLLKAVGTEAQVRELCSEARRAGFASVCVNPVWVPLAARELSGCDVLVCTVIGFPLGANRPETKAAEARLAVAQGAAEVDMVMNLGAAKAGDWAAVEADIRTVVDAAGAAKVKVILETCYLAEEEKVLACEAALRAGARFVKTSTGFGTGGATVEDIRLMRRTVGDRMQVKASGGVRTCQDALALLGAGADRIGASASLAILDGLGA